MSHQFKSDDHRNLYGAVLRGLHDIGYSGKLLQETYPFANFFASNQEVITAPAVAFGRLPADPNTACFVVVVGNGERGEHLVARYRSLGAPRALEVRDDSV